MLEIFKDERYMDEKYFFRIQRIFLRFIGFWPSTNYMKNYQIRLAIFNSMIVLVYGVFQLNYCIKSDSLVDILDALTPASTQIVTGVKVLIVVYRRNEIKIILDYLYEFFVTGKRDLWHKSLMFQTIIPYSISHSSSFVTFQ